MNQASNTPAPVITPGLQIPFVKKPFLGRIRANLIIAFVNALIKGRVVHTPSGPEGFFFGAHGGLVLQIQDPADDDTSNTNAVVAQRFRIKSVHGDYWTCHTWDGTTEGSTSIVVARPALLRCSVASRVFSGITVGYSYTTSGANAYVQRTASASAFTTETHQVVPTVISNDEICGLSISPMAVTADGGGSINATYFDLNVDGRKWSAVPVDPPP